MQETDIYKYMLENRWKTSLNSFLLSLKYCVTEAVDVFSRN